MRMYVRLVRFVKKITSKKIVVPFAGLPMDELSEEMIQFSGMTSHTEY